MTVYGDAEPEDSYDAGDPPDVIVRNLVRRLDLLAVSLAARGNSPAPRDLLRLAQVLVDLDRLRARLGTP